MKILMVAAENGALPGGKVGGMGDVLRDIPRALAALGHQVDVVTPGYQHFSTLPEAQSRGTITGDFAGRQETFGLFLLEGIDGVALKGSGQINHWILEHPGFAPVAPGMIYTDDPPGQPFATDATKFALFSRGVVQWLAAGKYVQPDIIHLHDWHTACVAILLNYDPRYLALKKTPLVFTIHNLALQGIRPFRGEISSLEHWYPGLQYAREQIGDSRYAGCVNPMRAAVNLCGRIHAVSPTYAREIQLPSRPDAGFTGGEGLELDLQRASREGRLHGILNGCEYPGISSPSADFAHFTALAGDELLQWLAAKPIAQSSHLVALRKLDSLRESGMQRPEFLATSVGRITGQKIRLLLEPMPGGRPALEQVLEMLASANGMLAMLGNGDGAMEQQLNALSAKWPNFLFLKGYSEPLSHTLYGIGDLFIMPSSFEPCGISQMLAMRASQPCLAHRTGGLADTISDGDNGFLFGGESPREQAANFLNRLAEILALRKDDPARWESLRSRAGAARFSWADAARGYEKFLYDLGRD